VCSPKTSRTDKLIPMFLSRIWNENYHFKLQPKMLVFMPKTGVDCRSSFSIVGAQLCLFSEKNFLLDECYEKML
jgi:hypothetical protein